MKQIPVPMIEIFVLQGAVGIEIWTMSENVYFDNILITESLDEAKQFAEATFKQKLSKRSNDKVR